MCLYGTGEKNKSRRNLHLPAFGFRGTRSCFGRADDRRSFRVSGSSIRANTFRPGRLESSMAPQGIGGGRVSGRGVRGRKLDTDGLRLPKGPGPVRFVRRTPRDSINLTLSNVKNANAFKPLLAKFVLFSTLGAFRRYCLLSHAKSLGQLSRLNATYALER